MNESAALNASSDNPTQVHQRFKVEQYIVSVVFGLIFLLDVIGNGSLMFIICRYKSIRNLPNIFVFNLALGDLFILLFAVPFTSTIYTFDKWPFSEFVCKASEFAKVNCLFLSLGVQELIFHFEIEKFQDTSVSVSVFTLTTLSFDRYRIIVKPVQSYAAGPKMKQFIIIAFAVIWFTSVGLALPAAIFSRLIDVKLLTLSNSSIIRVFSDTNDDKPDDSNQTKNETSITLFRFCYPFPGTFGESVHSRSVILGRFLIQYIIPLVFIGTFYTITARNLLRRYS